MIARLLEGDPGFLMSFNTFVWIVSNIIIFLIFVASLTFSVAYPVLFKITTTGGIRLWRAILSIAGFGFLSFLGIFIDPTQATWLELPPGISWWRPVLRLAITALIAASFWSLSVYLFQRRFFPQQIVIAPEVKQLMESDLRIYYGSGTGLPDPHEVAAKMIADGWIKPGLREVPVNSLGVQPRPLRRRPRR